MSEAEPSGLERARTVAAREKEAYEAGSDRPVGSFLAIMGVYLAGVGGLAVLVRRRGRVLPERFRLADLALLTVATHKLSRLLAKDSVTSPLRAPFTTFAGTSGPGRALGEGPRQRVSPGRGGAGDLPVLPGRVGGYRFGFLPPLRPQGHALRCLDPRRGHRRRRAPPGLRRAGVEEPDVTALPGG